MKIWYFENTHRDESNDILYDIIYLCILVEKYCKSNIGQNYTFSNGSSIVGRRECLIMNHIPLWQQGAESETKVTIFSETITKPLGLFLSKPLYVNISK